MKKIALILLAAASMAACTTPTRPEPASDHAASFHCTNGETVRVRFYTAKETAVLVRQGEEIELAQQRSASGFIYSNGPNTIFGKGDKLTIEVGRMVPIQCVAQ